MMRSMWQSGKKNQPIKREFPKSFPILEKITETTLHLRGNGGKRGKHNVLTPIGSQFKVDADLLSDLTALKTVLEQESSNLTLHTIFGDCGGNVRWILKFLLVNDSLLDIGSRFNVHKAGLDVISAMSLFPDSSLFLGHTDDEESSISDLLENLTQQCAQFLALYRNQKVGAGENDTMSAAHMFSQAVTEVQKLIAQKTESTLAVSADGIQSLLAPLSISSSLSPERQYLAALRPLKFEAIALCDLITSGATQHQLLGQNSAQYLQNSSGHGGVEGDACKRLVRVACEMSGLSASLPVEFGSAVFVRCDEARMDILKALIIGPEDTPYANGCFEFDILLPPAYPSVPPKVQLVTTGGGTVRFNPNLYDCGTVCLSLLGTWSGPGWDAAQSTLLQVLVSIQSLILVPDPYFNEPGYEHHRNAPSCISESEKYDQNIRTQTLRFAILGALQSPSPVFREVITQHFYHKREAVRLKLTEWARISGDAQRPAVTQLASEIKAALDRVESDVHSSAAVDRAGEKARCSDGAGFGEMKSGGGPKG